MEQPPGTLARGAVGVSTGRHAEPSTLVPTSEHFSSALDAVGVLNF